MTPHRVAIMLASAVLALTQTNNSQAQGTLTFNSPWLNNGLGGFTLIMYGPMSFRVVPPGPPPVSINEVKLIGAIGPAGYPHNGTPYVAFINTLGTSQSVLFAQTNAASLGSHSFLNGTPFGLASVDLSDPVAPSLSPVSITFNGFKGDGSLVSQTFTVGGGGSSSFQTVTFGPDFAHGLLRVEIPSPRWAMDNLVWIPEPSVACLLLLGLGALAALRKRRGP
jgi:hypothetical protein